MRRSATEGKVTLSLKNEEKKHARQGNDATEKWKKKIIQGKVTLPLKNEG
jgi:hypothetical protein